MSILDEDIYDDGRTSYEEKLAEVTYESGKENILAGFKIFQKKYVYKNVFLQMFLVVLGLVSQIFSIISSKPEEDTSFSWMLIMVCVCLGFYVMGRPKATFKNLEKSLDEVKGCQYKSEIFTDKIIISTIYDPAVEDAENDDNSENEIKDEKKSGDDSEESEKDMPPATVIHLDNEAVELIDCKDMFIVYVKKVNIFVIPKSAFKPYEIDEIKRRLSNIMGVRYKEN